MYGVCGCMCRRECVWCVCVCVCVCACVEGSVYGVCGCRAL